MYRLIVACIAYKIKINLLFLNKRLGDDFIQTTIAIRNRILQLCNEHDLTINKLADISAVPPSSVKNILYGKSQNPKILTVKKLCDGLGITLGEFFSTTDFDALEQEIE